MNRKFIGVMSLFLIILFGMYGVGTKIVAKSKIYETESTTTLVNKNDLEDLSIYFLTPYITKAVQDYYGKPSGIQWWKPKILEIKNLEPGSHYKFLLKIRVETFKGAHNPPYGIDIITLEIDFDKIRIIDYKHIEEKIKNKHKVLPLLFFLNNGLTNQRGTAELIQLLSPCPSSTVTRQINRLSVLDAEVLRGD